jgi:hypothetical protein
MDHSHEIMMAAPELSEDTYIWKLVATPFMPCIKYIRYTMTYMYSFNLIQSTLSNNKWHNVQKEGCSCV